MKNAIRCIISCILPCGALDVIRIVHCNGRVDEISGTVRAAEIMRAHPKHVLRKPSSAGEAVVVVVPPDAVLQRGKIYFLMPAQAQKSSRRRPKAAASAAPTAERRKRREAAGKAGPVTAADDVVSDRYLSDILSEKVSTQRDRRRGRVGVWRPHLKSISEAEAEAAASSDVL